MENLATWTDADLEEAHGRAKAALDMNNPAVVGWLLEIENEICRRKDPLPADYHADRFLAAEELYR